MRSPTPKWGQFNQTPYRSSLNNKVETVSTMLIKLCRGWVSARAIEVVARHYRERKRRWKYNHLLYSEQNIPYLNKNLYTKTPLDTWSSQGFIFAKPDRIIWCINTHWRKTHYISERVNGEDKILKASRRKQEEIWPVVCWLTVGLPYSIYNLYLGLVNIAFGNCWNKLLLLSRDSRC